MTSEEIAFGSQKMVCFHFGNLFSYLEFHPKTAMFGNEKEKKWFDNLWENRQSSDFQTA